jgi:hypothetical protein
MSATPTIIFSVDRKLGFVSFQCTCLGVSIRPKSLDLTYLMLYTVKKNSLLKPITIGIDEPNLKTFVELRFTLKNSIFKLLFNHLIS